MGGREKNLFKPTHGGGIHKHNICMVQKVGGKKYTFCVGNIWTSHLYVAAITGMQFVASILLLLFISVT